MTDTSTATRLPYGAGSIQFRGQVFWACYKTNQGELSQVNTHTADRGLALKLCAQLVLAQWRERLADLEAIADGRQENQGQGEAGGRDARRRGAARSGAAGHRKTGRKGTQGGTR